MSVPFSLCLHDRPPVGRQPVLAPRAGPPISVVWSAARRVAQALPPGALPPAPLIHPLPKITGHIPLKFRAVLPGGVGAGGSSISQTKGCEAITLAL